MLTEVAWSVASQRDRGVGNQFERKNERQRGVLNFLVT